MLLIRNIGQLVTVSGASTPRSGVDQSALGIIENAAIVIEGGLIAWVGEESELRVDSEADIAEIDAIGRLVTPGLVDAHTHLVHGGRREREFEMRALGKTYAEIMSAGGGIYATVEATRKSSLDELVSHAEAHLKIMLAHGTTTVEAKSGYGLDIHTELRQLEAVRILVDKQPVELVATFMGAHAVPSGMSGDEFTDWLCETAIPEVAAQGIAKFNDVFCERGVFTAAQTETVLQRGKEFGLMPKIHADELCDTGGAALAARAGAISADHLHCASEAGLAAMADAGTVAVLLPGTAVFLGLDAHAPARRMIDLGVPVALGTDFNPGSCYCESMPLIMSFACSQFGMTPAEAWVASTINAACAIGLEDKLGSIERGKQADLVIWDADDYRMIPYHMGINLARTVIKRGEVVRRN